MSSRPNTADFSYLFLNDIPLMDVRAPVEFKQGSMPNSINAPLMNDIERQKVGTCYKQQGQQAAIDLGHQLVSGDIREARIQAWCDFAEQHPEGYLFCFRGGLRSHVSQAWMLEAGVDYPLIEGGYKAMRRYLIDLIDEEARQRELVILSGRTGTGKTKVIDREPASYDLEGLANHRGSSFGRRATAQPSQINFENQFAVSILKARQRCGPIMVEDESVCIGSVHIPHEFFNVMKSSPMVLLEEPMENRIDTVIEDYVEGLSQEHRERFGEEQGWLSYQQYMLSAVDRIRKRLGAERHEQIKNMLQQALNRQIKEGDLSEHRRWIATLLQDYYDPMYDYQFSKKPRPVLFRGNRQAVLDWFSEYRAG